MLSQGWSGGKTEERRKEVEELTKKNTERKRTRDNVGKMLGINPRWWGSDDLENLSDDSDCDEEDINESVYVRLTTFTISFCKPKIL